MSRPRKVCRIVGLVWLVGSACVQLAAAGLPVELKLIPDKVRVGGLYHGGVVRIVARVPACDGVIITLEGDASDLTLNKTGRVVAVWLNVAQIEVKGAPSVYLLAASGDPDSLCPPELRRKLGIGYEALRLRVTFESDGPLDGGEFAEFLKLQEHRGTYDLSTRIDLPQASGDRHEVNAQLPIPSVVPPGTYDVRLYCFAHGNLVADAAVPLALESAGLPQVLNVLARAHAALYGLLAITVAMGTGVLMGVVFSSKGGARH